MATTDKLRVELTADSSSFRTAMNSARREANEFGETAQKSARKAEDAFSNLKSTIVGLGIGQIIKTSITDAMNAVESESLFETSLGGFAGEARAWSQELSESLGLDPYALRRNLGTLYNMTNSMGLTKEASYAMGTSLVELSEDMASFYNMSSEDAFAKIRSGLTGEAEPLKALGILLDEQTVKQTAYKHGLAQVGEELSNQEKVMARYYAIMEQTSTAQGDLARTIDSPANQLRIMMNDLKQASIEFGTALMPIVQEALPILRQVIADIKPVVVDIAEGFSELSTGLQLLESPAVRTVGYTVALIGVMNKLKLAVGGPLSAILLLGTAISWLVGKFGETEKAGAEVISDTMDEAAASTDEVQISVEELGDEFKKTGDKAKSMLAGFDEITKLSGAGSANLVSEEDVNNANEIKAELSGAGGALDDVEQKLDDIFGKEYTATASISEIGIPDVDWDVVMTNFKTWAEEQDWRKAWQDVGTAFISVFQAALSIADGLFGTELAKWYDDVTNFFFDYGVKAQLATDPSDEGLKALEQYEKEHGNSAWADFYALYKSGVSPEEAFGKVYSTPNLEKGFLAVNADLASYYIDEWAGLDKTEIAKRLEKDRHAEDMIAQSFRINDDSFMGIEGGVKSIVYDSFADYRPQNVNVMDGYELPQLKEPVAEASYVKFPVSVTDITTPLTAEDAYHMASSGATPFVGPVQIKVESIMDGEKVGEGVAMYGDNQTVNTNGRQ